MVMYGNVKYENTYCCDGTCLLNITKLCCLTHLNLSEIATDLLAMISITIKVVFKITNYTTSPYQ